MPVVLLAHLVLTAAYLGFQWTVQVLVYRQFALVPPEAFAAYERAHQRRISLIVGPLFVGQVITTIWLVLDQPAGLPGWLTALPAVVLGGILGLTALSAVPLHRRLSHGWDPLAFRSLLNTDLARAMLATANTAMAMAMILLVR